MKGSPSLDEISGEIVDAAYKLHSALGPGLLESAYDSLLSRILEKRGLRLERQKAISFEYDGLPVNNGFRIDLLVENCVVVEVKSVELLSPIHTKQLLTYLRVLDLRVELLINFGGMTLKEGLRRVVNAYQPPHYGARLMLPTRHERSN